MATAIFFINLFFSMRILDGKNPLILLRYIWNLTSFIIGYLTIDRDNNEKK